MVYLTVFDTSSVLPACAVPAVPAANGQPESGRAAAHHAPLRLHAGGRRGRLRLCRALRRDARHQGHVQPALRAGQAQGSCPGCTPGSCGGLAQSCTHEGPERCPKTVRLVRKTTSVAVFQGWVLLDTHGLTCTLQKGAEANGPAHCEMRDRYLWRYICEEELYQSNYSEGEWDACHGAKCKHP